MNKWFTRFLYGIENGVEDGPKAWIVREEDNRLEPTPYEDYPNPKAAPVLFRPRLVEGSKRAQGAGINGIGRLELVAGGRLDTAPEHTGTGGTGTLETLVDNHSFGGASLARAEWSSHRLLYATPPLADPIHISGTPRVTIRMAADRPAANLSVWLVALPWTNSRRLTDDLITRGWADPRNRNSLWEEEPLVPGEFVEVTFDLQPDDQVIPAGAQIGLMIFSSDRDFTLWPEPGTELTIDLDGTLLELPIVGGAAAFGQ